MTGPTTGPETGPAAGPGQSTAPGDAAAAGRQSAWWVVAGTVVTGLSTYVLLVVAARAVGPDAYGDFGVFWAATVIVGLGVFLPMEQETTRRGSGLPAGSMRSLWRRATRSAGIAAGCCVAALGVAWVWVAPVVGGQSTLLVAFAVCCAGYLLQFPGRGVLAATRRFRDYAVVAMTESVLRAAMAVVLWMAGGTSVLPYAAAVAAGALAAGVASAAFARAAAPGGHPVRVERFGRDSARLVVAAGSMQTLLNSGTVVAKVLSTASQAALAGQLMAVLTIARLPVMVFQSVQAAYLSRLAARWNRGDVHGVRVVLAVLAVSVGALAVLLVVGAATIGPWVTSVVFGPAYVIDRSAMVLIALGVAAYLIAAVASDAAVAVRMHPLIVTAWVTGLVAGIAMVLVAPTLVTQATLPLVAGATIAGVVLVVAVVARTRARAAA